MQSLISVIVPIYNVEKFLNRCIESIVNQTYKNLEIILVDDGSPDNCPEMCDRWAEKDSRIKVLHKKNGGVSSARNAGLDIAGGDLIAFADADDYVNADIYEKLFDALLKNNADIVSCNIFSCNRDTRFYPEKYLEKPNITAAYLSGSLCTPGIHNKLYKKSVIKNIRFDVTKKISEDYLFNYYAFKETEKAVVIEDKLYCYYYREDSAVNELNDAMINRWNVTKFILENEPLSENEYNVLFNKYVHELMCCLRELIKSNDNSLINRNYCLITDEIKNLSKEFLQIENINLFIKFSVKLIVFNDKLFKLMFRMYLKIKGE